MQQVQSRMPDMSEPIADKPQGATRSRVAPMKRPFYLIADGCNTVEAPGKALRQGANAIACDVRYNWLTGRFYVRRAAADPDLLFPPAVLDLADYLREIRSLAMKHMSFILFIVTCRDAEEHVPSRELLAELRRGLGQDTPLRLVVALSTDSLLAAPRASIHEFLQSIAGALQPSEALSIETQALCQDVHALFARHEVERYCFSSRAATAGTDLNLCATIVDAVELRMRMREQWLKLVYAWTPASQTAMMRYVELGIDGMVVSDVRALHELLGTSYFQKWVRLATRADNPFASSHSVAAMTMRVG